MAKRFKTVEAVDPAIIEEAESQYPTPTVPVESTNRPAVSKLYLFAGNARIVVSHDVGGLRESYTFAVKARAGVGRYAGLQTFFVRVKATGGRFPYRYLGIADPETGVLTLKGRSEFAPGSKEFDVAAWAIKCIVDETPLKPGRAIHHDGTCGKCNRTLVSDIDIGRGFDDLCWKTLTSEGLSE
jgi:hypothetical protein